jgi:hypothetical protein
MAVVVAGIRIVWCYGGGGGGSRSSSLILWWTGGGADRSSYLVLSWWPFVIPGVVVVPVLVPYA